MNITFSKYNSKGSSSSGSISSSNGGGSSSSNSSEFAEVTTSGINRILWGNTDDGDDLNETMWVNGNIHIGEWEIEYEEDEDGELDDELPILPTEDEDAGTGNLYATGKIEADSTYGKTVYLDYPERKTDDSNKTDLLDILKDHDTRITKNRTDIDNIDSRVTVNEGDITNIYEILDNLGGEVGDIEIPTKVSELENDVPYLTKDDLLEDDKYAPKILFSGLLISDNADDSNKNFQQFTESPNMCYKHSFVDRLDISYVSSTVPTLKIDVKPKSGYTVLSTSVTAMVLGTVGSTWNSTYNPLTSESEHSRSAGYWCTGGADGDTHVYINVWRTDDNNNDSTVQDCVAWRVTKLSVTIFGIAYKY